MANMNFGVNILPKANNTYSLGNSDYKWNVYLSSLNNTALSGTGIATTSNFGLLKASGSGTGLQLDNNGYIKLDAGTSVQIKAGTSLYAPVTAGKQHESVFYGLTKAAGVDMASSGNSIGVYTDAAKLAIANMLSVSSTANLGTVEEGTAASANIVEGQYVVWKGALYQANQAITSGATLSTTNLTAITDGGFNDFQGKTSTVFKDVIISHVASLEHTVTLPTSSRTLVCFAANGSVERFWLGFIYVNNSGGVRIHEIDKGTNVISVVIPDNTTNQIKITLDASMTAIIRCWNLYGNAAS